MHELKACPWAARRNRLIQKEASNRKRRQASTVLLNVGEQAIGLCPKVRGLRLPHVVNGPENGANGFMFPSPNGKYVAVRWLAGRIEPSESIWVIDQEGKIVAKIKER